MMPSGYTGYTGYTGSEQIPYGNSLSYFLQTAVTGVTGVTKASKSRFSSTSEGL